MNLMLLKGRGKYAVVIFEDISVLWTLSQHNRDTLLFYCTTYKAGILVLSDPDFVEEKNETTTMLKHLKLTRNTEIRDLRTAPKAKIIRTLKADTKSNVAVGESLSWATFDIQHSTYSPVILANMGQKVVVLFDRGKLDSIPKVLFGHSLRTWQMKIMFIDAIYYLARKKRPSSYRNILVDIDDIFVGRTGIRLKPNDVQTMIASQQKLQKIISNFHYNLGFSGNNFRSGSPDENGIDFSHFL